MRVFSIEAIGMGNCQQEIADKVEELVDGVEFPDEQAFSSQEGELITRACNDLGWASVPQNGGLVVNWDS
jgi:hypothetical protein